MINRPLDLHTCIVHVRRYFSIIGVTLHRWGKQANRTTKCLGNQGRTKGEGWSAANSLKPPSNFIAGRRKAALLFWFFSDFRCSVPLFIVILSIYKYKNR